MEKQGKANWHTQRPKTETRLSHDSVSPTYTGSPGELRGSMESSLQALSRGVLILSWGSLWRLLWGGKVDSAHT